LGDLPEQPCRTHLGLRLIQTHDLLFRPVYAFFLVHLASRRASTSPRPGTRRRRGRHSRCATPPWMGTLQPVVLRDRDGKFGPAFDRAAQGVGTKVIRTAIRAPNSEQYADPQRGTSPRMPIVHPTTRSCSLPAHGLTYEVLPKRRFGRRAR
jgi:hypothetical protein